VKPPPPPPPPPPPAAAEGGESGERQQRPSSAPPPAAAASSDDDGDDDEAGWGPSVVVTGVVEGARLSLLPSPAAPASGELSPARTAAAAAREQRARQAFSVTFLSRGTFAVEPRRVVARRTEGGAEGAGGEGAVVDSSSEALYVVVE